MEGISDIKIIGIDEKRPPKIRKEPYIDVIFQLSHQAPADWCRDLNNLMSKHPSTPKVDEKEGLYITSWVRSPDEIASLLKELKEKIYACSCEYINRIELSTRNASDANDSLSGAGGEQGRLNQIIADLDFSDYEIKS